LVVVQGGDLKTLSPEVVAGSLELGSWPLPAVLDTDCVRTGLHFQVRHGCPPRSVRIAQDGPVRLFMEYDTLAETSSRLPRFAEQLGVPTLELRRVLNEDWLPHVGVVKLPPPLRQLDQRAVAVRERDAHDYPAAALAALLSPCLLITHNYRHFGPLGVLTSSQGVDGVLAVVRVDLGEARVQAAVAVPALPALAIGETTKWAAGKIGPVAWVILGGITAGGAFWYLKQPQERRERIKKVAGGISSHLLAKYNQAAAEAAQACLQLQACLVPKPESRTRTSAILRELAVAAESLSAEQLAGLLDPPLRSPVATLRAYLRANDQTIFDQVRRGGFALGHHYELPDA
jgi:hypothetical protein